MIFPAIEEMRIPIQYLANMLTAGDTETVKEALATNGDDAFLYACSIIW